MTRYTITAGSHTRLGARHDGAGVNFAVFSDNADRIELCLFSPDAETQVQCLTLPERTGAVWHGYVAGLPVGTPYGYRAHGPWAPQKGHLFNPAKLLLDPYAREWTGTWQSHPATLGHDPDSPDDAMLPDSRDSAPFVPKGIVSDPGLFTPVAGLSAGAPGRDLIYEAHPKGLTRLCDAVPEGLRGSYDALGSDAVIAHLKDIGASAVELLPVHGFVDDAFLVERGLTNYWGYNSIGFFALEPRYFGPGGIAGFRDAVARLHGAGIAVILDVVYNHTAEGDHCGPTLCFRGLDNAAYYRLTEADRRLNVNDTGCGNTLNLSHPFVLRMVMDSLRFWVDCMGVDGFRFDLATTLGREDHGFDPDAGFFDALRQDPVLADVQLIAEPWDIGPGGYRLGGFPPEFREWNDTYRDTVRRFWRGDDHSAPDLAARLLGLADRFDRGGRRATASVNFIAAHDGFTLADTVAYAHRHNEANTEGSHDGHKSNFSDNFGVEGPARDPEIRQARARRQRNMLASLFLSQGTPMLLGGDEFGNSQSGNNNAYCQDNATGWLDWDRADTELQRFVRDLSALRQAHPVLRQTRFLHGETRPGDGLPDVEWAAFGGGPVAWGDAGLPAFRLILRGAAEAPGYAEPGPALLIAINRGDCARDLHLPDAGDGGDWWCILDTAADDPVAPRGVAGDVAPVAEASVVVFAQRRGPA